MLYPTYNFSVWIRDLNPPKSPLKRGTLKAPFLRGLGDLDIKTQQLDFSDIP